MVMSRPLPELSVSRRVLLLLASVGFLAAGGWLTFDPSGPGPRCAAARAAATAAPRVEVAAATAEQPITAGRRLVTKPIEQVRVGDRVLGTNPDRGQVEPGAEPDPATWVLLALAVDKPGGGRLEAELLRPADWVCKNLADGGAWIDLDLPELGVEGLARVEALLPCPPIRAGGGPVVTGTFRHRPTVGLVEVRLEGDGGALGCTANHPFWSEDRQAFVQAGELKAGERVLTRSRGAVPVQAVTPRTAEPWVYNLEVFPEHVYEVGTDGALVHNSCTWDRARAAAARHGGEELATPGHFQFPNRRSARQAASEIAGNLGQNPVTTRLRDFRGLPPNLKRASERTLDRVIGRQSADGKIEWRDDFLGHSRFGAPPHVNVSVQGTEFHLFYGDGS
jgi:Pretoxin HINT domain